MPQRALKPLPNAPTEALPRPHRRVGVARRCGRGLDRLGRLTERCLKAIGQAYLDGVIAYGAAMHGVTLPTTSDNRTASPLGVPVWRNPQADMAEAPFRDVDELFAWLETHAAPNKQ